MHARVEELEQVAYGAQTAHHADARRLVEVTLVGDDASDVQVRQHDVQRQRVTGILPHARRVLPLRLFSAGRGRLQHLQHWHHVRQRDAMQRQRARRITQRLVDAGQLAAIRGDAGFKLVLGAEPRVPQTLNLYRNATLCLALHRIT